jgi:hypothetical protein
MGTAPAACTTSPSGNNGGENPGKLFEGELAWPRLLEAGIEILPHRLTARRERQPEAQQGVGGESLGQAHRQAAPPQGPLPHPGHVPMAGESDLARLGEPKAHPALLHWIHRSARSGGGTGRGTATRAHPAEQAHRDAPAGGQILSRPLAAPGRGDR